MTCYHEQKYQTFKKLLKCSVVLGIFNMLKEYYDLHPHILGHSQWNHDQQRLIMPLMMTLSKWSLRVCYHFSQGQVIYSNLATVATVILWSWAETETLCSPSTVWDDSSRTMMVKQANFVDELSWNYFHNITRWRATVTLRSLSRLSLRRSVRYGTGDNTRRPPTALSWKEAFMKWWN